MKRALKMIGGIILIFLLVLIGYIIYLLVDYHRVEDQLPLEISGEGMATMPQDGEYTAITYNIGFSAYTPEFSFFMDGGTESRAFSKESVIETTEGIIGLLLEQDADFLFLEEVDEKATRSYHVNERKMIEDGLSGYSHSFGVNYDSSYLFYPFHQPHGKSLSGVLTFSKYQMTDSLRRSLPVETSLMKFVDLDRCYVVSRLPVDNGKELVLFTAHLSAYTSDGTIATEQLKMLVEDMQSEYEKGNYVICGADFNKDLLGDSSQYFGVSAGENTWAQPFPAELLKETDISLPAPVNEPEMVPTTRYADAPYHEDQLMVTVDGFLVSENVEVLECTVIDNQFLYSDHQPVKMSFRLL